MSADVSAVMDDIYILGLMNKHGDAHLSVPILPRSNAPRACELSRSINVTHQVIYGQSASDEQRIMNSAAAAARCPAQLCLRYRALTSRWRCVLIEHEHARLCNSLAKAKGDRRQRANSYLGLYVMNNDALKQDAVRCPDTV